MINPRRAVLIKRQVNRLVRDLEDPEEGRFFLELLLSNPLMFPFGSREYFSIVHDDCDGDQTQTLEIIVGDDGDMHIKTNNPRGFLRFRNFIGGGMSLRVWSALRILALAMRLDERR